MSFLDKLLYGIKLLKAEELLRRYFVMNGFDGILTAIGVLLGAYVSNNLKPTLIVNITLASGIALCVSGFFSAYITERAERLREIRDLERALLKNLDNTIIKEATLTVIFALSIVNGISPLILEVMVIIPFFLGINPLTSFYSSLALALIMLFILGSYLGYISREQIIISGLRMVGIGILCVLLMLILKLPPE